MREAGILGGSGRAGELATRPSPYAADLADGAAPRLAGAEDPRRLLAEEVAPAPPAPPPPPSPFKMKDTVKGKKVGKKAIGAPLFIIPLVFVMCMAIPIFYFLFFG
eukprot:scaffold4.g4790.t1